MLSRIGLGRLSSAQLGNEVSHGCQVGQERGRPPGSRRQLVILDTNQSKSSISPFPGWKRQRLNPEGSCLLSVIRRLEHDDNGIALESRSSHLSKQAQKSRYCFRRHKKKLLNEFARGVRNGDLCGEQASRLDEGRLEQRPSARCQRCPARWPSIPTVPWTSYSKSSPPRISP